MHSLKIKYDDSQNIKQKQWVLAYQKGDVEAAENLLKEFEPLLYKLSYNLVENQIDEDLLQDLRIVFLEKAKTYKEEKHPSFAGYVKRALGWAKIDCLRKDISYKKAEAFDLDNSPEPLCGEIQPVLEEKDVQVLMQKILGVLNKNQKEMFLLMVSGKSKKEIGALLHISPQSVYNKQKCIRNRIKRNQPLMEELKETFGTSSIWPDGYVDRHEFLFQHTWGVE